MYFVFPFLVTGISSLLSSFTTVPGFFDPFGRPFGFPDFPLLNWFCLGGFPYPMPGSSLFFLVTGHPPAACQLIEGLARLEVDRMIASVTLPASDCGIDVERVQFHAVTNTSGPIRSD